jgi:hypothetical protein
MYFPDGSIVENLPSDDTTAYERITDRNGNRIYLRGATLNGIQGVKVENDVGQFVFVGNYSSSANENKVIVPGANGELLETTIHWHEYWVTKKYRATSALNAPQSSKYIDGRWTVTHVDSITLPQQAGGRQFTFDYKAFESEPALGVHSPGWGFLKTLTLPSGAIATYAGDSDLINPDFVESTNFSVLADSPGGRSLTYHTIYDGVIQPSRNKLNMVEA